MLQQTFGGAADACARLNLEMKRIQIESIRDLSSAGRAFRPCAPSSRPDTRAPPGVTATVTPRPSRPIPEL